ncbi:MULTISPECIES: riboflavin synthase [Pseudovibrio]|uniref:riboflavin synthase n=1 Tax=Stappiaceae TaxID=2821832 RepID=UPI002365E643|nr:MULTISPECIES: riboflavin synthase [Pseudovibrio]MDD7908388.1 riboflavin synthase [Pseudovibrio exalbescens]MDX5592514.1 riboflavin synthase [Pseudovibrio sp. SPO723]
MFTGIVTDLGKITSVEKVPAGLKSRIACSYEANGIAIGASIACGGVCHTVIAKGVEDGKTWFEVESATETLQLTTVAGWKAGDNINLERSLAMGDELGGHLVLGHVDGTATIIERTEHPDSVYLKFECAEEFAKFIPKKGSVCLDGTSLTVNEADGNTFSVFLIPHTLSVTTWGDRKVGDKVNLEVDMMSRYVARLAEFTA